jgi:hypothetical protein
MHCADVAYRGLRLLKGPQTFQNSGLMLEPKFLVGLGSSGIIRMLEYQEEEYIYIYTHI